MHALGLAVLALQVIGSAQENSTQEVPIAQCNPLQNLPIALWNPFRKIPYDKDNAALDISAQQVMHELENGTQQAVTGQGTPEDAPGTQDKAKYRGAFHWIAVDAREERVLELAGRVLRCAQRPDSPRPVYIYAAGKMYNYIYRQWLYRVSFLAASYRRGELRVYNCVGREGVGAAVASRCRPLY